MLHTKIIWNHKIKEMRWRVLSSGIVINKIIILKTSIITLFLNEIFIWISCLKCCTLGEILLTRQTFLQFNMCTSSLKEMSVVFCLCTNINIEHNDENKFWMVIINNTVISRAVRNRSLENPSFTLLIIVPCEYKFQTA